MKRAVEKTEEEWRQQLTPLQFRVLRRKGTEPPFTGEYWDTKTPGIYRCRGCGAELFDAEAKYDSGTGWPSFHSPARAENIETAVDRTFGMERTEVLCRRCGSHLGHRFDDGPPPTGLRYCVNSASLKLEARQ